MKGITAIILLLTVSLSSFAQSSDYEMIEQTLNNYLEGGTNNDFEMLKKAFHPTATMKYMGKDGYTEVNAISFFEEVMEPGPKQNRITRISYISHEGSAANARLVMEYPTFMFVDYMNLLKIGGEWKIVGKIFYRQAKSEE